MRCLKMQTESRLKAHVKLSLEYNTRERNGSKGWDSRWKPASASAPAGSRSGTASMRLGEEDSHLAHFGVDPLLLLLAVFLKES